MGARMFTSLERYGNVVIGIGAALLLISGCMMAVTMHYLHPLPYTPRAAIKMFLVPILLISVCGWLLPTRKTRFLTIVAATLLIVWLIGLQELIVVSMLLLSALCVGDGARRLAQGDYAEPDLLGSCIATVLGIAVIGLLLTALSYSSVLNSVVYALGMVVVLVLSHRRLAVHARSLGSWLSSEERVALPIWIAAGAMVSGILINILMSTQFGNEVDTLGVYMYIPSYVGTYGGWTHDVQQYIWAVMPNTSAILASVPYVLSGPTGAQFFNSIGTVLIALLIYAFCRPRSGAINALLAAIGWLCLPVVVQESSTLHVDTFLALFMFAALVYLNDTRVPSTRPWAVGLIAGLLISAAVATKLMGWIICPVLLLFVFVHFARKQGYVWCVRVSVAAVVVVLLAGGFQYWYALAVTGNPIYPYYNAIFHSPYFPLNNFVDHSNGDNFNWQLPFSLTFHAEKFAFAGPGGSGYQWLLFLPAGLMFMLLKDGHRSRWFGLAGLWFAFFVLLPEQFLRYLIPAFPFLSVFIAEVGAQPGIAIQVIYRTAMIAAIALDVYALQGVSNVMKDIPYQPIFSLQQRAESERDAAPIVTANKIINAIESRPVNVLYASKGEAAELRGTGFYPSWLSPKIAEEMQSATTPAAIGDFVGRHNISYIILETAVDKHGNAQSAEMIEFCRNHGDLITRVGHILLYRIDPEYTYQHEAVLNPTLDNSASGWTFSKPGKPQYVTGLGFSLANNEKIVQQIGTENLKSNSVYHFDATVNCTDAKGWVIPMIFWWSGKSTSISSTLYFCSRVGPLEIHEDFVSPEGVTGGRVSLSANNGAEVAISRISVRY